MIGAVQLLVVLAATAHSVNRPVPCDFHPIASDDDHVERCAVRDPNGTFTLLPEAVAQGRPRFRDDGIGEVVIEGAIYFVNAAGRTARAFPFDNGADYFVEGLARTVRSGKVGFVDTALNEVVRPVWDFARPFSGGYSIVCQGCTVQRAGEYGVVVGGQWGAIDKTGRVVVPIKYLDGEAVPLPKADE